MVVIIIRALDVFLKQNSCRWTSSNCRHGFDAGFMKSVNQKFPVI